MCAFLVANHVIAKIIVAIKYVSLLSDSKSWNYKELEMKVFRFKEAIVYKKKCLLFNKLKSCSYTCMQIYPHAGTCFIKYAYCAIVYSK